MIDWEDPFAGSGLANAPFSGLMLASGGKSNFVSFAFLSYDRPRSCGRDHD